jgi:hypothetical protein
MSYRSRLYNHRNAQAPEGKQEQPFFSKKSSDKKGSKSAFFQAKLSVNEPGDKHEQEADTVADAVVNKKNAGPVLPQKNISSVQRLSTSMEDEKLSTNDERMKKDKEIQRAEGPDKEKEKKIQKMNVPEKEKEKKVQKKPGTGDASAASPALSSKIESTAGKGSPLPKNTLQEMNTSFGSDFSNVNIHNDSESAGMNKELNAHAFTHGSDIYFNSGKYDTNSAEGKKLLAHELTHTIQQGEPAIQRALAVIDIDAIADEIHKAVDGLGTDEERIFVSLQRLNKDPGDIAALMTSYKTKYGTTLEAELRDEMSGSELRLALELIGINDNPAGGDLANKTVPASPADFTTQATRLQTAMAGLGTDEETIYAVLLPFNRDVTTLNQLKAAYKTLTGNELQADIEDEMSSDELHYALYLLNGQPNETPRATTSETAAGTSLATGPVTGGTTSINSGAGYTPGFGNGFSIKYQGGISNDSRWLQFIWREIVVTRADGSVVSLNDSITNSVGKTYNLTTDPSSPHYNTDTASATNPFYEGSFTAIRTADSTSMYDMPGSVLSFVRREFGKTANPVTGIVSRAHFNTFLVRDYRPMQQMSITVEWTFTSAAEPPRVYSLDTAKAVDSLPSDIRNIFITQFPNYSYIE